jgi:hypothetical protein
MSDSRSVLDALWPEGAFWTPATDDDYDKLLDGIADNTQFVKDDLEVMELHILETRQRMKDGKHLKDLCLIGIFPELMINFKINL